MIAKGKTIANIEKILIVLIVFPIFAPIFTLPIYLRYPIILAWMLLRIRSAQNWLRTLFPYLIWLVFNVLLYLVDGWYFGHYGFYEFMYSASMYLLPALIFLSYKNDHEKSRLIEKTVLISLYLGTIITIVANILVPGASRILAQGLTFSDTARMLSRWGCKDFSGIYASALFMPVILFKMRNDPQKKLLWFGLFVLSLLMIYVSDYTTAMLLVILAIFIDLLIHYRPLSILGFGIVVVFILLIPSEVHADVLLEIRNIIGGTTQIGYKLYDLSLSIRTKELFGTVYSRSEVYRTSIDSFKSSFFLGAITNNQAVSGDHSSILDLLACFGLLGFSVYMWHLIKIVIDYKNHFKVSGHITKEQYALLTSFILYIVLGMVNPVFYSTTIVFCMFLAVPASLNGVK